jgi:hypothetical protein
MKHWFLRPACLPIPSPGQFILILIYKIKKNGGQRGIRTPEVVDKGFTVLPI